MFSRLLTLSLALLCLSLSALVASLAIEQGILVYESYQIRHAPAPCCPCHGCPCPCSCPDCKCDEGYLYGVIPDPKRLP